MKSRRELILTVLVVVLLGSLSFTWVVFQGKITQLSTELEAFNRKIGELQDELIQCKSKTSSLEETLAKRTSEVSNLQSQIQTMETLLAQSEDKINFLERQIEELEYQIEEFEGRLSIEKFAHLTIFVCWSDKTPVLANQKSGYVAKLELRDVYVSLKDHPEKVLMSLESWSCSKNNTKFVTMLVPIFSENSIVLFEGNYETTYGFQPEETGFQAGDVIVAGTFESTIIVSEDTVFYTWW